MIMVDDYWCSEAESILPNTDKRVLVASLNKRYDYNYCKQFDLIASCTTGTDHIDNRDIPLIKLEGEFLKDIYATAEHTWALILSLIRKVAFAFDDVKQGNWEREKWQGTELRGKTLGIVGMGRIGQQIARMAEAFGMKVITYDTTIWMGRKEQGNMAIEFPLYQYCHLEHLLQNSDIITVHVPLTEETKGMFSIEQFKQMKPTAYFINTSRGAVVDEDALLNALHNDIIAGAAIDVTTFETERKPFGEDIEDIRNQNELVWYAKHNDNLIITPHIGGNTIESREKTQIHIANKIKEYIQNEM